MTERLDLPQRYRSILEALLREHVPDADVWAYGSRITGESHEGSDLDLVVRGPGLEPLGDGFFSLLEAIEESNIPILVQAHDWARLPESFHGEIRRDYVVVQRETTAGTTGEWSEFPFSEAVSINPTVQLERGTVYPFVEMAAVNAESRTANSSEKREFKGSGSRFQVGDTLMARITPCLENGKIARYQSQDASEKAHGSTEFIVIRGRPGVSDNDFAYYLTQWEDIRNYAIGQMTGTSGRQRVPVDSLDHLIVSLPPLSDQRAIAHVLGTLDDKIELNRRMNETLEEMARAIFKSWFVDFDPVHAKAALKQHAASESVAHPAQRGVDGEKSAGWTIERARAYLDKLDPSIATLFPDRFVESELGEIPEGWEVKALDQIANFRNGLALQKFRPQVNQGRLPVVKIAQLRSGAADSGEWAADNITSECILEDGDVVFSWSGSLMIRIWCGGRAALNQHLFKVTSAQFPKWLYLNWIESHLVEFQGIASDKATTMGHIKRQHLSQAKCAVPPSNHISEAAEILGELLSKRISILLESNSLTLLRDALLPRLVSGKVRAEGALNHMGNAS